ncbi:MAG: hypothetical protein M1834_000001 [Cirrosporium novae-zelandiae]|nr:MAG: hypothetical protein M1834_000001 [Cirrosporium novae-zelandiae]
MATFAPIQPISPRMPNLKYKNRNAISDPTINRPPEFRMPKLKYGNQTPSSNVTFGTSQGSQLPSSRPVSPHSDTNSFDTSDGPQPSKDQSRKRFSVIESQPRSGSVTSYSSRGSYPAERISTSVPVRKRKSTLISFFTTREPSAEAFYKLEQQMQRERASTPKRVSAVGLSAVSSAKLPAHVPKVNSSWDGIPESIKQKDKERRRSSTSSRVSSLRFKNNSLSSTSVSTISSHSSRKWGRRGSIFSIKSDVGMGDSSPTKQERLFKTHSTTSLPAKLIGNVPRLPKVPTAHFTQPPTPTTSNSTPASQTHTFGVIDSHHITSNHFALPAPPKLPPLDETVIFNNIGPHILPMPLKIKRNPRASEHAFPASEAKELSLSSEDEYQPPSILKRPPRPPNLTRCQNQQVHRRPGAPETVHPTIGSRSRASDVTPWEMNENENRNKTGPLPLSSLTSLINTSYPSTQISTPTPTLRFIQSLDHLSSKPALPPRNPKRLQSQARYQSTISRPTNLGLGPGLTHTQPYPSISTSMSQSMFTSKYPRSLDEATIQDNNDSDKKPQQQPQQQVETTSKPKFRNTWLAFLKPRHGTWRKAKVNGKEP